LKVLVAFAVGKQNRLDCTEHPLQLRTMQAPDVLAGDDESPRANAVQIEESGQLIHDAVANEDRRAGACGDVDANGIAGVNGGHSAML